MKIYALVGKSGTGKSYQAINLCREKQIESIIDDGLFIFHNNDVVGRSAKREANKVSAIKTALFTDDDHRQEVVETIAKVRPESILILGTSEKMVERIRERLDLPEIGEMIHIEDITTEIQRVYARKQRDIQGKHIVPVPSAKLKKTFSGYFMTPIRRFRFFGGDRQDEEKTVVRPTYSYLGEFLIAPQVVTDIVTLTGEDLSGVEEVVKVTSSKPTEDLNVTVQAVFNMEENVAETARILQERCAYRLEEMTAFSIGKINVDVRAVKM